MPNILTYQLSESPKQKHAPHNFDHLATQKGNQRKGAGQLANNKDTPSIESEPPQAQASKNTSNTKKRHKKAMKS